MRRHSAKSRKKVQAFEERELRLGSVFCPLALEVFGKVYVACLAQDSIAV